MIERFKITNFGPIKNFSWEKHGNITLCIGANATGKTFLLKGLYSFVRSIEEFGRGNDPRKFEEVLAEKLYWTFQVDKLGQLLSKGSENRLEFELHTNIGKGRYAFGEKTSRTIPDCENGFERREFNSVFIPAKEVLSLLDVVLFSREQQRAFGFDDSYFDLVKALSSPTQRGKNFEVFSIARKNLEQIIGGKLSYDEKSKSWVLQDANRYKYPISLASEGVKKIGIFDTLLGNRYLSPDSVLFVDEPESALHPVAQNAFLEIIAELSKNGIQVFLASHSYFIIKKLFLISKKYDLDVSVLSFGIQGIDVSNLKDGMPENEIIKESIRLFEEEVELSFNE